MRGVGNSSPVTAEMAFSEIIKELEAIREVLGFEKWAFEAFVNETVEGV